MIDDVVIVGAGPAGLATAIALGRLGFSVTVVDRRAAPIDKPCGEGIMPTGVALLGSLGIASHLPASQRHAFQGIRYVLASGRSAVADFAEGPGWVVRRTDLSWALERRLAELPHVRRLDGAAKAVQVEPSCVRLDLEAQSLRARLLIGADGLNSTVRRLAQLELPAPAWPRRWGARQHFARRAWSERVEVYWADGYEAYVSPCGDEVGVAVLWHSRPNDSAREERGGDDLVRRLCARVPELRRRLGDARASSPQRAVGPLARRVRAGFAPGVSLVGDAAGYLDALTGEGISLALAQAHAAGAELPPALARARARGVPVDASALARLGARTRQLVARHHSVTRCLLELGRHPRLLEQVVALLSRNPELFRHFLSANMGRVSPWALHGAVARQLLSGWHRDHHSSTATHPAVRPVSR